MLFVFHSLRTVSTFADWHPEVQKSLLRFLAIPALVLPRAALDWSLITRTYQSLLQRGWFSTITKHLSENYAEEFHERDKGRTLPTIRSHASREGVRWWCRVA